jgi:dimethylargininase
MFTHAITRKPGRNFSGGITTSTLGQPDYLLMVAQHQCYVNTLRSLGLQVQELEPLSAYPDAYFVEDVAVVFPEAAVITRPGAPARRGEEDPIQPVLEQWRKPYRIQAPGTLDGGDVLMVGKHFFIGISKRSNKEGAEQLGSIVSQYGYTWTPMPLEKGLHFKSYVNMIGYNILLVTESYAHHPHLETYKKVVVDNNEDYSANTLLVNDYLITPAGFPGTSAKLKALGMPIIELDISEARKMDGALTCLSLRF